MTGWSWKLGRVAGIDVYMHGTFLILLAWVGVSHYLQCHHLADAGAGIVFVLVIKARPVESRVHEVLDLVEKPKPGDAPSDLAIIGRYVLPPEIFEILAGTGADARGEIQLTDALRMLRARRPIYGVEFEGRRYDTGDKLGFLKATVEFALARPDLADDFRTYLKSLNL